MISHQSWMGHVRCIEWLKPKWNQKFLIWAPQAVIYSYKGGKCWKELMNTYNKNTQKLTVSHKSYYPIRNSRSQGKIMRAPSEYKFSFPTVSSRECVYFYSALRSWIIKLLTFTSWWGPRPCFVGLTTSFTGTSQTVPKITFKGATGVKLKGRIRWWTYSGRGISVLYKFNWAS